MQQNDSNGIQLSNERLLKEEEGKGRKCVAFSTELRENTAGAAVLSRVKRCKNNVRFFVTHILKRHQGSGDARWRGCEPSQSEMCTHTHTLLENGGNLCY